MNAGDPPGDAAEGRLLEALVASAPDALYVVDSGGDIRLANPAALSILGYDGEQQLRGRPSHATIPGRRIPDQHRQARSRKRGASDRAARG
jgi:PAS domain S-box-containing protein